MENVTIDIYNPIFVNDYVNVLLYSNQSVSATLTGPDGPLVSGASYQYALTVSQRLLCDSQNPIPQITVKMTRPSLYLLLSPQLNGGQPKSANITLPLPPADLPITSPESVSVGTTCWWPCTPAPRQPTLILSRAPSP